MMFENGESQEVLTLSKDVSVKSVFLYLAESVFSYVGTALSLGAEMELFMLIPPEVTGSSGPMLVHCRAKVASVRPCERAGLQGIAAVFEDYEILPVLRMSA